MVLTFSNVFKNNITDSSNEFFTDQLESKIQLANATYGQEMSSSTTLVPVGGLSLPIKKNAGYNFQLILYVKAQNTTPDMDILFVGPVSGAFSWQLLTNSGISATNVETTFPLDNYGDTTPVICNGTFQTDSTASTVIIQWAQHVSNAAYIYIINGSLSIQRTS